MKLVADAVRDILLYLENNLEVTLENNKTNMSYISYVEPANTLTPSKHYSKEEVIYAIQQLYQNGMINVNIFIGKQGRWINGDIYDITWQGHEFINNIRIPSIWEAAKSKAGKLGGLSIKALSFLSS